MKRTLGSMSASRIPVALKKVQRLILAASIVAAAARANAGLVHRYSFNDGTANDSVGSADGTLVGTNASISGGELILANVGQNSENPGTAGGYLNLPNGLISSTAAANGAVTIEMWITMTANRDWAAAFTAGSSLGGEDTAHCCNSEEPYIQIIPRSGDGGQGNDVRVTSNSYGGDEGWVDDLGFFNGTDLTVGVKEHLVSVFDQSAGLPGTITVYRNGDFMGIAVIAANLDLKKFLRANNTGGDVNVWLGRSQWPDPLVAARYEEVRIYDTALTQDQAHANYLASPNKIPEPASSILLALAVAAIGWRHNGPKKLSTAYSWK